jgi:hypothetical protein
LSSKEREGKKEEGKRGGTRKREAIFTKAILRN